jgi:ABC-2 type transport system permease protein
MRHKIKPQPYFLQVIDLIQIQLSNWRWSWRSTLIVSIIFPILSMLVLRSFSGVSDLNALTYIFIGNIVLSIMFENIGKVGSNFAFMKHVGTLTFFASLPVLPSALVLSSIFAFFIMSLPALISTITCGLLILKIPLAIHPMLLIVLPLVCTPLAGLGALIGIISPTPETVGPTTTFLSVILLGIGPVMIPPDRLPAFLLHLDWLSPASYAASALRQTLIGPLSYRLLLDLGLLAGMTSMILWLVSKKIDWRSAA